jgi:hypothetical protein
VEERTADFVMTTEQLKREIRNQKKDGAGVQKGTNTNFSSTTAGNFWGTNSWFCQWN